MTATPAAWIAAIEEVQARGSVDVRGELEPYTGPEPIEEYLSGDECDRRAGLEEDRRWRQWP